MMNEITIYHNPRCSKSRAGLETIQKLNKGVKVFDYLKEGLDYKQLEQVLSRLNIKASDLIRTHEELYKTDFKGKNFSEEEWLQIIVDNPKLLKRPIIIKGYKAMLGNDEIEITNFLK